MKIELPIDDLQVFINKKSNEVTLESLDNNKMLVRIKKFKTNTLLEVSIVANDANSVLLEYKIVNGIMARLFNVLGVLRSIIGRMEFVEAAGSRNEYIVHPFRIPALKKAGEEFLLTRITTVNNSLIIEVKPV